MVTIAARRSCLEMQLFLWHAGGAVSKRASCLSHARLRNACRQCFSEKRKKTTREAGGSGEAQSLVPVPTAGSRARALLPSTAARPLLFCPLVPISWWFIRRRWRGLDLSLVPALLGLPLLLLLPLPVPQIGGRVGLAVIDPIFQRQPLLAGCSERSSASVRVLSPLQRT